MKLLITTLCLLTFPFVGKGYAQVELHSELYKEITKADSLLFEAGFNNCDLEALSQLTDDSLQFYHDTSGITSGSSDFIEGIRQNICSIEYRPLRKLVAGSQQVYPLEKNGTLYGAIQKGLHEFYAREKGKEMYLTSTAAFTNLWIKKKGSWILQTVLSYNHQVPGEAGKKINSQEERPEDLLSRYKVPALGLAHIKKGRLEKVRMYGHIYKGQPAPQDAVFNVASLAKPVVSMLTLQLAENGDLDLDEPVHKYWTDPDVKDHPFSRLLTTRHILAHQSGFDNWRWQNEDKKLRFKYKPGDGYGYSGEGFEYLQKALESKFGISLEKLADSLIFEPLNMNHTSFTWRSKIKEEKFARWHDSEGENTYDTEKNRTASAADNLLTTVGDYGRFAEYVLERISSGEKVYQEMIQPNSGEKVKTIMGLGWEILPGLKNDEYALVHSGGDVGVNTLIMLLPETGEGIVIFTNGDNGNRLFLDLIATHLSLGAEANKRAQ